MGILYLVPTPVGNLEDITLRALRILREVSLIAAEDTRTTGRLLAHFEIKTPLTSYHQHNETIKLDAMLEALSSGDVALVSDAGTPGLSDPGYELIRAAIEMGIPVVPLPGASALLPALIASGLPTDAFTYLGFLPRKAAARRSALEAAASLPHTLVIYEAPHRLTETLTDLKEVLGVRQVVIAREISKLYEEFWRGTLDAAAQHFAETAPRGEIVIVVAGNQPQPQGTWSADQVRAALADQLAQGTSRSAAARAVADKSGWSRREIYNLDVS
jgi:16S rRNA (cytidine1402-2'-O)-methyltransferase